MIIKKQLIATIGDLILFFLLITLIGYAGKRMNKFILVQKQSYIHELDRTFIDYLYTTQQQLQKTKNIAYIKEKSYGSLEKRLNVLQQHLSCIEGKYSSNSPGLTLLGPIGTMAIVLKEQNLAQQLYKMVHEIGSILHDYLKTTGNTPYQLFPSIEANLRANKAMIKQLQYNSSFC